MAQTTDPAYKEVVVAPRWLIAGGLLVAYVTGVGVGVIAESPEFSGGSRFAAAFAMVAAGITVGFTTFIFSRLKVVADDTSVRFGFGPFVSTLELDLIVQARPVTYNWLRFGGWGVRWSWNLGGQAYSVPFLLTGVEIKVESGRSYFVSSRHPNALAGVIDSLTGRPSLASL